MIVSGVGKRLMSHSSVGSARVSMYTVRSSHKASGVDSAFLMGLFVSLRSVASRGCQALSVPGGRHRVM